METTRDYTPEEVAELLRVHRETVYRWLRGFRGRPPILRGYQLPNKAGWRVTPEDVSAFKRARMNEVQEMPASPETPGGQEG